MEQQETTRSEAAPYLSCIETSPRDTNQEWQIINFRQERNGKSCNTGKTKQSTMNSCHNHKN